jgi:hypothetical protein
MDYVKGILGGLAAILIAEFVFFWPFISGTKATGMSVITGLLVESVLSLRFSVVAALSFGCFFAASRGSAILRVLFFWVPTLAVSALGLAIVAMYTYLALSSKHH